LIRLGWRDVIYAALWAVVIAVPVYVAVLTRGVTDLLFFAIFISLAILPGVVFTVWYVGRRRQP